MRGRSIRATKYIALTSLLASQRRARQKQNLRDLSDDVLHGLQDVRLDVQRVLLSSAVQVVELLALPVVRVVVGLDVGLSPKSESTDTTTARRSCAGWVYYIRSRGPRH